jgi:hypothetical protein
MTYIMQLVNHILPILAENFNQTLKVVFLISGMLLTLVVVSAQDIPWAVNPNCVIESAGSEGAFEGLLVLDAPDDGWRALRSNFASTYYLAFTGSNFLDGAAVSPDGSRYVVPYGTIVTVAQDDVRYAVSELRIVTTATVPRITRRIPWTASFPVGTAFTTAGNIPRVRWLDEQQITFPTGSLTGEQPWLTIDIDASEIVPFPSGLPGDALISPTLARMLVRDGSSWALNNIATGATLAQLDNLYAASWSPNGAYLAAIEQTISGWNIQLYSAEGSAAGLIAQTPIEQIPGTLRWSPDGNKLAFGILDPQTSENRLMVAELLHETVDDLCMTMNVWPPGREGAAAAMAWSPDSDHIAVLVGDNVEIANLRTGEQIHLARAVGGLIGWFSGG